MNFAYVVPGLEQIRDAQFEQALVPEDNAAVD